MTTQDTNPNEFTTRDWFEHYVGAANKAAEIQATLAETRTGSYACLTNAARCAGDATSFAEACADFAAEIKANVDGIAVALKCKPGPKPKEGESQTFKMPSSWKVAKSVLKSALELEVPLSDEDDEESPKSFTKIREEVAILREQERIDNGPDWLQTHKDILETLDKAEKRLELLTDSEEMTDETKEARLNVLKRRADDFLNHVRAQFDINDMRADAKAEKAEKAEPASDVLDAEPTDVIRITDKARDLVVEHALDIGTIVGTGKDGTITVADVRAAAKAAA